MQSLPFAPAGFERIQALHGTEGIELPKKFGESRRPIPDTLWDADNTRLTCRFSTFKRLASILLDHRVHQTCLA